VNGDKKKVKVTNDASQSSVGQDQAHPSTSSGEQRGFGSPLIRQSDGGWGRRILGKKNKKDEGGHEIWSPW